MYGVKCEGSCLMGIINALNQISKNNSNFKKWEAEQENIDAKRKKLAKKDPPSQEELAEAKKLGKTIIDVVDIMDQHSEDIAENVETATEVPLGLIPAAVFLASGFFSGQKIVAPADKEASAAQTKFLNQNSAKIDDLIRRIKSASPKETANLDNLKILDKNFIKNANISAKLKVEAGVFIEELSKINKKLKSKYWLGSAITIISTIGAFVASNVYATKMQIDGSKIARFQARKVLNDPKFFVKYTPEQIAQAEENLKNDTDKKSGKKKKLKVDKLQNGMFKGIGSIMKDKPAYDAWKASADSKPEKINRPLTQEELDDAKRDQEVIQRVVRQINNTAEIYSQNMEVAAETLIGGTPILGALIGAAMAGIMNAAKIIPNYVQKAVDKYGDKEAQKAYQEMIKVAEDAPGRNKLFEKFYSAMKNSKIGKNIEKNVGKEVNTPALAKMRQSAMNLLPVALSHKWGRNAVFGITSGFMTGIIGAIIGLKLQKASARAGRYVAKRELAQNPQNFIGYTDEDFESVPNKKSKKEKQSKIKETISFLPNVFKQYREYKRYEKTTLEKEKLLQEELTKLNVSDKQIEDAKNLQRKVFNTFEAVDDKSQEYSESVEATAEIAQPFVIAGGFLALLSPAIIFGIQAARGKVTAKSVLNKIVGILSGTTNIMNKKFFKNYLGDVAKQIPHAIQNGKYEKTAISELSDKKSFAGLIVSLVKEGSNNLKQIKSEGGKMIELMNKNVQKMSDSEFKAFMLKIAEPAQNVKFVRSLNIASMDKAYVQKMLPKIQKIIENIPEAELKTILDSAVKEYERNPEEFIMFIEQGKLRNIFMTKKLQTALKVAGVSWTAFTFLMTYIIECWLADLQLKAGRLGVMQALESLKDPAYYANSKPNNTKKNQKQVNTSLLPAA